MFALILAAAVTTAPLSPAGQAVVSAIQASIDAVRARQRALPPPKDDAERLVRMGELDQAPRKIITAFDFSTVPEAERPTAIARASALIEAVDAENQAALVKLVPHEGWFLRSAYGDKAAAAAFNIVQHADLPLQERVLPLIAPLVKRGEIDGQSYGMMFDRVAISHGRPQTYGTQFRCDDGKWRPYPILDPEHLDARRATLAFPGSYAEIKAYFDRSPPCPQTRRPPPPGMKLD
jgi:hypothetical protein